MARDRRYIGIGEESLPGPPTMSSTVFYSTSAVEKACREAGLSPHRTKQVIAKLEHEEEEPE